MTSTNNNRRRPFSARTLSLSSAVPLFGSTYRFLGIASKWHALAQAIAWTLFRTAIMAYNIYYVNQACKLFVCNERLSGFGFLEVQPQDIVVSAASGCGRKSREKRGGGLATSPANFPLFLKPYPQSFLTGRCLCLFQ